MRNSSLRHVLLVGGTVQDWADLSDRRWAELVRELGEFCARIGVPWLTVRVYEAGSGVGSELALTRHVVGGCVVIVDPCGDGRHRLADAMQGLDPSDEVNEATVASMLYEPADSEPDLVVVLGPPTQLPPSLVWELAYAELVFVPVPWSDLCADTLERAVTDFGGRRRRFGGLDDE
jgi:undecaprenyl diphosphate synthase